MFEWFSTAVASANAAKEIGQSLITLRDEEMVRSRVFALTNSLMDLQQQLMQAQLEQMDLMHKVAELEQQNKALQKQSAFESKYELHQFPTGKFAYRLKPDQQGDQPEHFLCSRCFERGIKSTMHESKNDYSSTLFCPECRQTISSEPNKPLPPLHERLARI